jgi:hypothetical protein
MTLIQRLWIIHNAEFLLEIVREGAGYKEEPGQAPS